MATQTIGLEQLATICEWFESNLYDAGDAGLEAAVGGGDRITAWCDARSIDNVALVHFAGDQATSIEVEMMRGAVSGRESLMAAVIVGVQIGVEAERRRRNDAELPS